MIKRKLFSVLLVLCMFIQIPIYAGAEIRLAKQQVETESEFVDVSQFNNSYHYIEGLRPTPVITNTPKATLEGLSLPEKYDSRKNGYITSVKDQYPYGTCWAFATMASSEASIIKEGLYSDQKELDLSEMYLAYSSFNRKNDPLNNTGKDKNISLENKGWMYGGCNTLLTAMHLAQWNNPLSEEEVPYSRSNIPSGDIEYDQPEYKLENAIFIPFSVDIIKSYIMKYGAVNVTFYCDTKVFSADYPYYLPGTFDSTHAVTIVGWDDTVSKETFEKNIPPEDGVWIVKNSWGKYGALRDGYFQMSQSQKLFDVTAYDYMKNEEYDYNYYYDGSFPTTNIYGRSVSAANIYEAKNGTSNLSEYIKGVSVNVASDNTNCEVQVYTNIKDTSNPTSGTPMLSTPVSAYVEFAGVYTIPLKKLIKIEKGTKFSVVVKLETERGFSRIYASESTEYYWLKTEEYTEPHQSFISTSSDPNNWNDLHGYQGRYRCASVKALTVLGDSETQDERKSISDGNITFENTSVNYSGNECKPKVSVNINGKKLTDLDYKVKYINNIDAGEAIAKVYGTNNYKGIKMVHFTIDRLILTNEMICDIEDQVYNASNIYPNVKVIHGEKTLIRNIDYAVTCSNNKNVGRGIITIVGKNNYTGDISKTFNILPCKLTESMMSDIEPQTYTGQSIKPNVTLMLDKNTLVSGTDYTVSYGENVNPGTGTINITGIGNYTGSIIKKFEIKGSENYSIIANAKSGGSIMPSGEVSVAEGQDQIFKINADNGYKIENVVVDGESVGNVSEYKFSSVSSLHTIEAFFTPIKAESIELSDTEITLKEGESQKITADVKPDDTLDKSLLWKSSDEDTVSVEDGVLTANKAGNAVITVRSLDGSDISATCNVTVTELISKSDSSDSTRPIKSTRSAAQVKKDKSAAKKAMNQAKITKLTAKSKAKKKIAVSWKKVKNAKGYQVQVSAKKNFKKVIYNKSLTKNKLTIKSSKIKSKKTYYVRVRAYATYKDANNATKKIYSKWVKKIRKVKVK